MAKRSQDLAAAKAKKQKIILIVGGVLLLGVAAIQGPKLLNGSSSPAATSATSASSSASPSASSSASSSAIGAAPTPTGVGAAAPRGTAMVAGIALPKAAVVKVTPSQLASFTLFDVKDPFVQRVSATLAATSGASGAANGQTQGAANSSGPTSSPAGGSSGSTTADTTGTTTNTPTDAAPPPPIAYATINFNGEPQQVQAKDKFPADSPLFVVRSIKKKQAKIGVAGGSFDDSQAVTLVQGKKVTLVNTATGVRYELKLVYTGAQPEVIKSFTTTTATTPGTTADSLSGSSQTTTTTK